MSEELGFQGATNELPPQSIEAEGAVLGGILLDPEGMDRALMAVSPPLEPQDFYVHAHAKIFQAMVDLHRAGKPTNLMLLAEKLIETDNLSKVGGRTKLADLVDGVISAANIDVLVQLIREKKRKRDYIKVGGEIQDLAYSPLFVKLSELQEAASEKLLSISDDLSADETSHISEAAIANFREIESRNEGIFLPGVPCGFYDLDAMTNGFQRGDLVIIAGRPSMGKTAFAVDCAKNIADSSRLPVIVFSLEMSKEQLSLRILSERSKIESGLLTTGKINEGQWIDLTAAVDWLSEVPIYINDNPIATPSYIASQIKKTKARYNISEIGCIVIDYLQLMEGAGDNRVQDLGKITRSLKKVARTFKVPVLCLSQLSRGVESRTNKRPLMSDLRESGSIEQDADVVIMLYRDEYYNPDTPDKGLAEIIITKHRNGPTGMVKLLFDPRFTTFKNFKK